MLNLYYLAAAVRSTGDEVKVLDLDRIGTKTAHELVVEAVDDWHPNILGVTICTETATAAYGLVSALNKRDGMTVVAGGPHPTAVPNEVLAHGFDVVVGGEGEQTLLELVQALRAGSGLTNIRGLSIRGHGERTHVAAARPPVIDLDELPSPVDVFDLFDTTALDPTVLTSRGCPGRCTFCANQVFGRKHRCHSVERVLREMEAWHRLSKSPVFNFCDAAFTVNKRRLRALCEALSSLSFEPRWWCEARADQLDEEIARIMVQSGCTTVLLGAESGDPNLLNRIGKGIETRTTVRALESAKTQGLRTEVSFMLGFPDETEEELENTLNFMKRIAPLVDVFRPMGIVVPYPATPLYEQHHEQFGFSEWWLRPERFERLATTVANLETSQPFDHVTEMHAEVEQAFLDVHPIRYGDDVYEMIQRCLRFRRRHNRAQVSDTSAKDAGVVADLGSSSTSDQAQPWSSSEGFFVSLDNDVAVEANDRRRSLLEALTPRIQQAFGGSKPHIGALSPGCVLCGQGYWSCLFVNAICNGGCFFCPSDMTYGDAPPIAERSRFHSPDDYADYVSALGFKGVGLSGGEPFLTLDKTVSFLNALRRRLGDQIYIWAYTNGLVANPKNLKQLADAGLDELRFNLVAGDYSLENLRIAKRIIPRVSVEIPAIPEHEERLKRLLPQLAKIGVDHLNLHELMILGQNAGRLYRHGYTFLPGAAPSVMESELVALGLLQFALDEGLDVPINYCGVAYKERWQYRTEDLRAVPLIMKGHETQAKSGLLRQISLDVSPQQADEVVNRCCCLGLEQELWERDSKATLHIHPDVLKAIDLSRCSFRVTYLKTILGDASAATTAFVPKEVRRIEVNEKRSIEASLFQMGPPLSLTFAEILQLLAGETPNQVRQFEETPVGLSDYC